MTTYGIHDKVMTDDKQITSFSFTNPDEILREKWGGYGLNIEENGKMHYVQKNKKKHPYICY